jgi:hypothetical protein
VNGVTRTHVTASPHAYCLHPEGGEGGGACPFGRDASAGVPEAAVYREARWHAAQTGHEVNVDALDRTTFKATQRAAVTA